MVARHVGESAGEEHREDAIFADRLMKGGDKVLLGDSALGEELFHQLVFALGDKLDESLMGGLGLGSDACRDFPGDLAASVAARSVVESLHRDQVDHAVESLRV